MIEQRELITISRQIGSMMEAGVDILRITRVLRAQSENPELLRALDTLDHDLRMGHSLADAMENAPELFSPFAVSLVRQGEARNDLAGAWHKIAEFLQKEDEADVAHAQVAHSQTIQANNAAREGGATAGSTPGRNQFANAAPSAILPAWVIDDLINRAQVAALRIFTLSAGLLLSLAAVWASVEAGFLERRWQNVVLSSVAALFIGGAGVWLRRRIESDRKYEIERRKSMQDAPPAGSTPGQTPSTPAGSTPGAASGNKSAMTTAISPVKKPTETKIEKVIPAREATFE